MNMSKSVNIWEWGIRVEVGPKEKAMSTPLMLIDSQSQEIKSSTLIIGRIEAR